MLPLFRMLSKKSDMDSKYTKRRRWTTLLLPQAKLSNLLCFVTMFLFLSFGVWKQLHYTIDDMTIVPIRRIKASDTLSFEEFFEYTRDKPIIIEGAVKHHPAFNLTFQDIKALCGKKLVETRSYSSSSEGAFGNDYAPEALDKYIDELFLHKKAADVDKPIKYASFLSLPKICVPLERFAMVNKYFTFDLTHDVSLEFDWPLHQPEFFLGPKGTITEIHIDGDYHSFWMNVYRGSKRFRTIEFNDAYSHFGKRIVSSEGILSKGWFSRKRLEIFKPDLTAFPELTKVTVYDGSVNAGDLIYLPPSMLHAVSNEEDVFALSVNALPLPHIQGFIENVLRSDIAFQLTFLFWNHCGCLPLIDGLMENEMTTDKMRKISKSCIEYSPKIKQKLKDLKTLEFKDRSIHELYEFASSDDFCMYTFIHNNLKAKYGSHEIPKGKWKEHTHEKFPECEKAKRSFDSFHSWKVYKTSKTSLQYYDIVEGTGATPVKGAKISCHYIGKLTNGNTFDESYDSGSPLQFQIGIGQVIQGWDLGILGADDIPPMKVGGKRKLLIPPELGYGQRGWGGVIPPGATLDFEVELLGV